MQCCVVLMFYYYPVSIIIVMLLCAVNQGACMDAHQAVSLVQRAALFSRRNQFCKYVCGVL